jgi:uncharacterized protein (DUF2147 family)
MMILMAAAAMAAGDANAAVGKWRAASKNAVVDISRCGPSICGKLVDSDGLRANPGMLDTKNKDAAQRGRKLMGIQMLGGFTFDGESWSGGTVYNPEDGGTYKGTVTIADPDHMRLKGCIVWPLCKTQRWTRVR